MGPSVNKRLRRLWFDVHMWIGVGLALATKIDDPQLAAAFDYALQQIAVKGRFAELYLRYFPVSFF